MFVIIIFVFILTLIILGLFSYGFVDPNLVLSTGDLYRRFHQPLFDLAYHNRPTATVLFLTIIISLFVCYRIFLRMNEKIVNATRKKLSLFIIVSVLTLTFSFPALTYDLFNYIATAKVTFKYHENPYLVMPVEIPNEPNLAFTRAANKVALYGPVWILLSAIPHYIGGGNVWSTVIAFKMMNVVGYLGFCYLIWRLTNNFMNVIFFALNPLVLIEVIMNGHNDIYMMLPALLGLYVWRKQKIGLRTTGLLLIVSSWLVKGATIVLLPLVFMKKLSWEKILLIAYCLLLVVFIIVAPLREELYPWYAVWIISVASLLDYKKHECIIDFTIVLSFALELRYLPYMWMGYYEGPGPILRLLFTLIPIGLYLMIIVLKRIWNTSNEN